MRSPPLAVRIRSEHRTPSVLECPAAILGHADVFSQVGAATHERPERRDP